MFHTLDQDLTMHQLQNASRDESPVFINFSADIRNQTTEDFMQLCRTMRVLNIDQVQVMLSSSGGLVIRGLELHNFIRSLPLDIKMHNSATVDSIANSVFVAAKPENRTAEPNARFMFHGVSRGFGGGSATEQMLKEALSAVQRDQKAIAETIECNTAMTLEEIKEAFKGERILTPEDAMEKGIICETKKLEIPCNAELINVFNPMHE